MVFMKLWCPMKKVILTCLTLFFLLAQHDAVSAEITKSTFEGKWCGKWDNMYSLCITIDDFNGKDGAKYEWLEHQNGKFKRDYKKIERVNRNTLNLEKIWFVLDEMNQNQATVMGVFRIQTRVAIITREIEEKAKIEPKSP